MKISLERQSLQCVPSFHLLSAVLMAVISFFSRSMGKISSFSVFKGITLEDDVG
jgi:hypothetical protein